MELNKIYYFSDQFGPKFIKVISIDDTWVNYYRCPSLKHIVKTTEKFFSNQVGKFICEKHQTKKRTFEGIVKNMTYNTKFIGCIKIPDNIIDDVANDRIINMEKFAYIEYESLSDKYENPIDVICKKINEQEFRNLKLEIILNENYFTNANA
jgi:hypothetical protein